MTFLDSLVRGRDNNLNLIRMIAALAVMVSHAVPIALGEGPPEPLQEWTGYTLGALAVYVFFAISGFLITGSFLRSSSHLSFVLARVLRLFPALIVCMVLTAFILGPLVTTLPVGTYLSLSEPYMFVLRNVALIPLIYTLPGVFTDTPYPVVAGSIWTLRHEVLCYVGVFLAGLAGVWSRRDLATGVLLAYGALWMGIEVSGVRLHPLAAGLHDLSLPFALGCAFHVWQHRLPIHLLGVLVTLILAVLAKGSMFYAPALALALGYTTFWLAYVPGGAIRAYNRMGDYSYGVYIYAMPMQVLVVWLFGPQTPWQNVLYALPPTLILSALSWHLVEGPAMATKPAVLGWWQRRCNPARSSA